MKNRLMVLLLWLMFIGLLSANTERAVDLDQIMRIATDFTAVMWEEDTMYPAEPIPLYGPDDKIIAWDINFSFKEAFPNLDDLKTSSDQNYQIDRNLGYANHEYAYVIVGANRDMPVIIESAKCLSPNIVRARSIEREASKHFKSEFLIDKIYYFGAAQIWNRATDGKETKYIRLDDTAEVLYWQELQEMIASETMFWDRDEFDEEWDRLLGGIRNLRAEPVYIPGQSKMPFYEWHYGCTPAAAAMVFTWWDRQRGANKLSDFYYTRYENRVDEPRWVHHAANATRILSNKMGTSDGGSTLPGGMADAMEEAAETMGFSCNVGSIWAPWHSSETIYDELKDVIDGQIPALTAIWRHSNTGVGYWTDTNQWFSHDTHQGTLKTFHRSKLWGAWWPVVSVPNPTYFELVSPEGGTWRGSNEGGEVLVSGNVHEISWSPHSHPNTYVQAYYHIEGGDPDFDTWIPISTNSPNNGVLNWMVPDLTTVFGHPATSSDFCRVRLLLRDSNTHALLAEDGSYGNFTITDTGGGTPWVQTYNYVNSGLATFAGVEYDPDAQWFVVGMRGQNDQWRAELYDSPNFLSLAKSSQYQANANYIVINYNEVTNPQDMGIKFRSLNHSAISYNAAGHSPQTIQTYTLYNKVHPANKAVDIYQVYLPAGTWYFDFGPTNLGFAIYRPEGNGFYSFSEARSWSRDASGAWGNKSFAYHATTAGWHALVVNSLHNQNSNYKIEIRDQVMWTGAVSTDWFDAANWTSPIAPTQHYDVVIPASAVRQPSISGGTLATAKSLTIGAGATLNISSGNLTVYDDLHVYGTMNLSSPGARTQVNCNGTVNIDPTGSINAVNNSLFKCNGHWSSAPGASVIFIQTSELQVGSYHQSTFYNASTTLALANMIINNYSGGSVTLHGPATGVISVLGTLQIYAQSKLFSESDQTLSASTVQNNGIFRMNRGTLRLTGGGGVFPNNSGDYFQNIELNISGTITLDRTLNINGNLSLNSGTLSPGTRQIYIKGNWSAAYGSGFSKGTSSVIFNGTEPQSVSGSNFYILSVHNDVHFSSNVTIDKYLWWSGALHLDGGLLLIHDLLSSSIMGKYVINDGTLILNQVNGDINLNADLIIHGGVMRIYGNSTISSWASGGPASVVMTGGTLDFANSSIVMLPSSHDLDIDISGGLIQTIGSFQVSRPGFLPTGGSVEMYGTRFCSITVHPGSRLNDLIINKASRGAGPDEDQLSQDRTTNNSTVTLTGNTIIEGSFMFQSGEFWLQSYTFTVNGEAEINGKLHMNNSSGKLFVKHSLYWNSTTSILSAGSIELQNRLEIINGSLFQMAAGTNLSLVGVSSAPDDIADIGPGANYTRIENHASGTRFGNLIIDKAENVYGPSELEIHGSQILTVLGNMTILGQSEVSIDAISVHVNGNLNNSATLKIINNSSLEIDGDTTISGGKLYIGDYGYMGCLGSLDHQIGSEMELDTYGHLRLSRPYAGIYYSLTGYVAIYETGCLEVFHNGLQIGSDNYLLDGGTIKIGWAFRALNPNTFNGGTGTVVFTGARAGVIQMHSTNSFHDLVINKPGLGYTTYLSSPVQVARDLIIQGGMLAPMGNLMRVLRDVNIQGGRLSMTSTGDLLQVARNWSNQIGTSGFDEGVGTVEFYHTGNYDSMISSDNFRHLVINKSTGRSASATAGATINVKGHLNINNQRFALSPGATLKLNNNSNLYISGSGELHLVGTSSEPVMITSDTGYYNFQTVSGSRVSAEHCIFEKMNSNGIHLIQGSLVSPEHAFSYCTFRNGASGGTLLKKLNSQSLTMDDPIFPTNTWSGAYNVYHAPGAGQLQINNATGGFAGAAFENDPDNRITWTTIQTNPYPAHSPIPAHNADGISPTTSLSWTYSSVDDYPDPIGYIIKMSTVPTMTVYNESYQIGGPGTYIIDPIIPLTVGNTYYWQIIPTTLPQGRFSSGERSMDEQGRGAATNCPIWSFTVNEATISSFPYYEDFESGTGGWFGGAVTGSNVWQWGSSTQFGAFSDSYLWATMLNENYPHNANSWLRSPGFNLSEVNNPMFRVWLNIKTEANWDGMILEYSLDDINWIKVQGDPGFYNNTSSSGPLAAPKWSGIIGVWTEYTTSIPALANQSQAYFRFRFASDSSVNNHGIAVEDIEIWEGSPVVNVDWSQNFDGLAQGAMPANWSSTTGNWGANNSSSAGGSSPEMRFSWSPEFNGVSSLISPEINTLGNSNLELSFRHMLDHYSGPYTLKLLSIVGATEHILREWVNPTASIQAELVTQTITAAQGAGAPNLRLAWVFSGNSYNINYWYIDNVWLRTPPTGPGIAHSPGPHDGATAISTDTMFSWAYDSQPGHTDPTGFKLRIGTSPTMTSYTERYIAGAIGFHTWVSDIPLLHDTTYYWQVVATTNPDRGDISTSPVSLGHLSHGDDSQRSDAIGSPIWSFSTIAAPPIAQYPYLDSFESGPRGWTTGAVTGNNHWQLGYPDQETIYQPYSGANAWMTYLNQNYENNANTWLKSPAFDFSNLDNPNLSVWLNIWSETSWDGMKLEYSLDNSTWQQVVGDTGFYNQMSLPSPSHPIWSGTVDGVNGIWTQYSTSLAFLASQPQVWFRFLFVSDNSIVHEGIALDDLRIWNTIAPPATAHSPMPGDGAIDVPLQSPLVWTYTSQPGYTDPLLYQVRAGTDPSLSTYQSAIVWAGPGTHSISPFFSPEIGQTYYWQVIPSANADAFRGRGSSLGVHSQSRDLLMERVELFRHTAENCPIWSYTVIADTVAITSFPYLEDFELSNGAWQGGRYNSLNIWQYGSPAQPVLNSAYSGTNAWMTGLSTNYLNNSDIWLRSPLFDFSSLTHPQFSVWIKHQSQPLLDGMLLEASIDGGNAWFAISADTGFYGAPDASMWSGSNNAWTQYSTALRALAGYSAVRLRFRFTSDASVVDEGFALDDIRIWNAEFPIFAITPQDHDFERVALGQSSPVHYFQISNSGAGVLDLHPENITIEGIHADDFNLINLDTVVALEMGQTAQIGISFAPTLIGTRDAVILISEGSSPRGNRLDSREQSNGRNLHSVNLSGFGYQTLTVDLPYYEGFSEDDEGSLPAGWESNHSNWQLAHSDQAGGSIPELFMSFDPQYTGEISLLSPLFDTTGLSQLQLTLKHKLNHLAGSFDLAIYTVLGESRYLVHQWTAVDADIASQVLSYQLTASNHGLGANNLRLAFVFNGDTHNLTGWHIDDIILGGSLPQVATLPASGISHYEASINAEITSTGGLPIQSKGFYYGIDPDPQSSGTLLLSTEGGTTITVVLEDLEPGTTIYYIAFADNPLGRAWGSVLSVNTLLPQITLDPASLLSFGEQVINNVSAVQSLVVSGIDLLGDLILTAPSGFGLSIDRQSRSSRTESELNLNPVDGVLLPTTINVFFEPTETIAYNGEILISSPYAQILALAVSGQGIDYAVVDINPIINITQSSAQGGGSVSSDGASAILAKGLCWSVSENPSLTDNHSEDGSGLGEFTSQITELTPGTTYYVRAYATNAAGTAYSSQLSFSTVHIPALSASHAELPTFGSQIITTHSDAATITVTGSHLTDNLLLTAPDGFQISLAGRQRSYSASLTIVPQAGAVNSEILVRFSPLEAGNYSGSLQISSTGAQSISIALSGTGISMPAISTSPITEIGRFSARSGGVISSDGFSPITAAGICWSTSPNPSPLDQHLAAEPGIWNFSLLMTDLLPGTLYYVRSYAENEAGLAYGEELSFSTQSLDLHAPQNLSIMVNGNNISLSWDPVAGADSYKIYRSLDPDAADWGSPIAVVNTNSWSAQQAGGRWFYRVTSALILTR